MQSNEITKRIALAVKSKRRSAGLGVRAAAQQCGISAATISRLERGVAKLPDSATLAKIAAWANVPVAHLFEVSNTARKTEIQSTTPEVVEVHLRADKKLTPQTAKALSDMFRALYEQFTKSSGKSD